MMPEAVTINRQMPSQVTLDKVWEGMSLPSQSPIAHENPARLLLSRLKFAVGEVVQGYSRLDRENVERGGEEGAIIISEVDGKVIRVLNLLRDAFETGLKPQGGGFFTDSRRDLLPLLAEVTLKSAFQELLKLPSEVDVLFETNSDTNHLEAAWLIMALNEYALPQYVQVIRQNEDLARKYYEDGEVSIIRSDDLSGKFIEILHELETVYFQLDYQTYADQVRLESLQSSKRSASLNSVNQSLISLKINSSSERFSEGLAGSEAFTPQPESNTPAERSEFSSVNEAEPILTRSPSTHSLNQPRKSSPLKESRTVDMNEAESDGDAELKEIEVDVLRDDDSIIDDEPVEDEHAEADGEDFIDSPVNNEELLSAVQESIRPPSVILEPVEQADETSETRTTRSFEMTDTTLTTLSSGSSSNLISSEQDHGLLGMLPDFLTKENSLISNAFGLLTGHQIRDEHRQTAFPGDFEAVDRENETWRLGETTGEVEMRICPIQGLALQHFKCEGCSTIIGIADYPAAKLCQVSGFYFCEKCHLDDLALSPALILLNWDFTKVPVARQTYHDISAQSRTITFHLEALNPDLFLYVSELQETKKVRHRLAKYGAVFMECTEQSRLEIVQRVWPREHLLATDSMYTIEDLFDASMGKLASELKEILEMLRNHVTRDCARCNSS